MNAADYYRHVLDVYGPTAATLVAERICDDDRGDEVATYLDEYSATSFARNITAGYIVDAEREALARDPDLWETTTEADAHDVRASVIRAVAAEVARISYARSDAAYEARMSCRRRTNDCDCRTCSG